MIASKPTKEELQQDFRMLRPRDFEEYLGYVFMNDEPESVGDKDTFGDNLDIWLQGKEVGDILQLVEKYEAKTSKYEKNLLEQAFDKAVEREKNMEEEIKRRKNAKKNARLANFY